MCNDQLLPGLPGYPLCLDCNQGREIVEEVDRALMKKKRPYYRTHDAAKHVHPGTIFELFGKEENR